MTLKELRLNSGKTVKEVAQALNTAVTAVYNYENGIRRIKIEQVLILADLFGCTEREVITAQLSSVKPSK